MVSPLAIDPAHPFPFIPNAGFALALQLERKTDKRSLRALVPVPQQINRFVVLPGKGYRYLPLEELILMHLEQLFPGYALKGHCQLSLSCAIATWKSKMSPKIWCANLRLRSNAGGVAKSFA